MASNRNAVVVGIVVAGVAIGYLAYRGLGGHPQQAQGTIGAAKREVSQQIGSGDVQLSEAQIQQFLQSDTFHKLQTNTEFRRAWEAGLKDAASDAGLFSAARDAQVRETVMSRSFTTALKDQSMRAAMRESGMKDIATDASLRELVRKDWFVKASDEVFSNGKFSGELLAALRDGNLKIDNPSLQHAFAAMKIDAMLKDDAFMKLLSSPADQQLLASDGFRTLVGSEAGHALLADPGFARMYTDASMRDALLKDSVVNLVISGDLGHVFADPGVLGAFSTTEFQQAVSSPEVARALEATPN